MYLSIKAIKLKWKQCNLVEYVIRCVLKKAFVGWIQYLLVLYKMQKKIQIICLKLDTFDNSIKLKLFIHIKTINISSI